MRKRANNPLNPNGIFLLSGSVTLTAADAAAGFTTANDELELIEFPSKSPCYLLGYSVDVPIIDEHATPTIVLDVEFDDGTTTHVTSDGSAVSSTVGQTAGTIEYAPDDFILDADADDAGFLLDVSGYTMQLACTTAASTDVTSTATINFKVLVYAGDVATLGVG